MKKQPWIGTAAIDLPFIVLPPFLSLLLIFLFPDSFSEHMEVNNWTWIVIILFIDVGHVYSTLYRTYFDPLMWQTKKQLLVNIPLFAYITTVLVYSISPSLFWHLLAYAAVFHFIRQQYGFFRMYARKEKSTTFTRIVDTLAIYIATIYPLIYWHVSGQRKFNWFLEGDFFFLPFPLLERVSWWIYLFSVVAYFLKEMLLLFKSGFINVPKNLIMTGTILSWYFGIVHFNGDLIFTLLNVVSHGIPYMALIWIFGQKNTRSKEKSRFLTAVFSRYGLLLFLGILLIFSFIEEGLWDFTVWKENQDIFNIPSQLTWTPDHNTLALIVPLLALPQLTHYILDGFIWRIRKGDTAVIEQS